MTNSTTDRLVDQYLTRLADAAQVLPPESREELLSEIRGHITASMSPGAAADEAAVRTMLDRLGEPADIVAAALEDNPPAPQPGQGLSRTRQGIGLEVGAVVMLTVGSLIPLGWFVGVILLWTSGIWRRSEKVLATLIVPGGPGLALFGSAAALSMATPGSPCTTSTAVATAVEVLPSAVAGGGEVMPSAVAGGAQMFPAAEACTGSALAPVLGIALLLFVLVAPVVVAIVLLKRARSRAALDRQ
jgi:hypothetical protein